MCTQLVVNRSDVKFRKSVRNVASDRLVRDKSSSHFRRRVRSFSMTR